MVERKFSPQDYECPECGETDLLVRGPAGRGPMTREGPIADLLEDVGGLSPRDFFRRLVGLDDPEYVDVRLQCQNCDFDENYPANHELVNEIIKKDRN